MTSFDFAGRHTEAMFESLLKRLKMNEDCDVAMAEALTAAAREAGLELTHEAQEIIGMARAGDFRSVMLRTTHAVGLSPDEFQAMRALIYG